MQSAAAGISATIAVSLGMACLICAGCAKPIEAEPASAPATAAKEPAAEAMLPLVTGKKIPPSLAAKQAIGNLPMNLILSPDGRFAVTSDMGNREALWSLRAEDGVGVSHIDFFNKESDSKFGPLHPGGEAAELVKDKDDLVSNGLYYGLAFGKDNTLYAAQGAHDSIAVLSLSQDGTLAFRDYIHTRPKDFPAGLATDDAGRLYVANNASGKGNPFKLTASVAIYDPATKKELGRYRFKESHGGTSNYPLGIGVLRDGSKAYVAAERDDCVYAIDTQNPLKPALAAAIPTGARPVSLLFSRDQRRLFVANSLSDTVSIIDTKEDRVVGTVLLRPSAARELAGATPTAMALSPDEDTLYVTLADMNAVAVVDVDDQELRGYIATGWYPSTLAVVDDGRKLMVVNAKGTAVRTPDDEPDKFDPKRKHAYILSIIEGNVSVLDIPAADTLQAATDEVLKNNRLDVLAEKTENPLADIGLAAGKIKHVIYIIKENRTYDEVLGDLAQGNGDPSLVLFGRDVTPNQHALAERFVLLDNLYACGEVSGDGWCWSTQGMASAYVARNVPYNYSRRGRVFDYEGTNNGYPTAGFPANDADGNPLTNGEVFKDGAPPIPDVANTGRNIWDAVNEAHLSMRNFGFFLYITDNIVGIKAGPDNYPTSAGLQPAGHDLAGVTNIDYRRFDLDYPDSDAPSVYYKQTGDKKCLFARTEYGKHQSPSRFSEWNREFQMTLAKDPTGAAVPAYMQIRLPTDHTQAARSGKHSPRSYNADNDYALGQVVEAVSHSPIWASTAIFVIEDDAQSGADHVDCHRTLAYIISPWIKAHSVDHHFYNTDSMLKTIELVLGLKPLCQYDAVADPILDWDTSPANADPYTAILPPKEVIAEINPEARALSLHDPRLQMAMQSDAMDFAHPDALPALEANAIVWRTVKGVDSTPPSPRGLSKDDDD